MFRSGAFLLFTLSCLLLSATAQAQQLLYSNDFETNPPGAEWSATTTDVTPLGNRRFLGQFGNDSVSLSLNNLSSHSLLTLSFDLYLARSWDGNTITNSLGFDVGPDVWQLQYDGSHTLVDATFSNWEDGASPDGDITRQSYPDAFPGGVEFPAHTGAVEVNTLGFDFPFYPGQVQDSVYHFEFTLPHTAPSVAFTFSSIGLQDLSDESWGIDNVRLVGGSVAPEPSSLSLCGCAFVIAGLIARKRRA